MTVLSGNSPRELGERACQAVVPQRPLDAPILLKPNLCGFDGFKDPAKSGGDDGVRGRVTDVEFTRGVVRCLRERGHQRVIIADGCGNSHQHWQRAVQVSGYAAMAEAEQVPLVALDDDGVFDVQGEQPGKPLGITGIEASHVPTLLMPKLLAEVLERGLFITVPKLKAHRYSVVSIAIKGMQGTVMRSDATPAYNQKWRMHAELKEYLAERKRGEPEDRAKYLRSLELFSERMVDVLELSLPDIVLVDGAPAMAGDGFQHVRALPGHVAIAGTNPVLVDRVGAEYLGLWDSAELAQELGGHRTSPLIEVAASRHGIALDQIEIIGDGARVLAERRPVFFKALAPFSIPKPPEPPTARAKHAETAPVIDGRREALWDAAPPVSFQTDYAGAATGITTSVRFLWQEGALFALFQLASAGLNVDQSLPTTQERAKLYEEDCVELFLAPDPARPHHYYEVELGPLGHFLDVEIDRVKKSSRVEWSSGLELRTTHDAASRSAVIEAKLTAPELVRGLTSGARLPLALYRMEGKAPRRYLAWRPPRTPKPNFHVPEGFGLLLVEP